MSIMELLENMPKDSFGSSGYDIDEVNKILFNEKDKEKKGSAFYLANKISTLYFRATWCSEATE